VLYWLEKRGMGGDESLANRIFDAAKKIATSADGCGNPGAVREVRRELMRHVVETGRMAR